MKYFAYGSNMHPLEMETVSLKASFVTTAKLNGYRLDFTRFSEKRVGGVADIVQDLSTKVWGVVYEVPDEDLAALDTKEGVEGGAYKRELVEVLTRDLDRLKVMTYSVVHKKTWVAPTQEYLDIIIAGARHWHLPEEEIRHLQLYVQRMRSGSTQ